MTRSALSLETAQQLIANAMACGADMKLAPLTIAVLDAGGHLLAFARADGASMLRPQIAIGKASGALALGVSSRRIGEMASDRPSFIASLGPVSPAGIIPAAGGVLVAGDDGALIGAIGITGDTSDNDETCALKALELLGLKAFG